MHVAAFFELNKIYTYASLGEKNRIENEIMKMYTNITHLCTAPNATFQQKIGTNVGQNGGGFPPSPQ